MRISELALRCVETWQKAAKFLKQAITAGGRLAEEIEKVKAELGIEAIIRRK